uniref:Uncharacterized protein n=1 Tax=Tetranychus urticae TaxID=32264 RepID=T1KET8_TETUR
MALFNRAGSEVMSLIYQRYMRLFIPN